MSKIRIEINGGCDSGLQPEKPYTFRNISVTLYHQFQHATIEYEVQSNPTPNNLLSNSAGKMNDTLRDALRKINILHILIYDCTLNITTMKITVDDTSKIYDQTCDNFPFYKTIIPQGTMGLTQFNDNPGHTSWKDDTLIRTILDTSQTKAENKHVFIALYSYLAGKMQKNEYEKFIFYWTSINAMAQFLPEVYNSFKPETPWKKSFEKMDSASDQTMLKAMSYVINNYKEHKSARTKDEINDLEDDLFRYDLRGIEPKELYDAALDELQKNKEGIPTLNNAGPDRKIKEVLENLKEKLKGKEAIFTFFLLQYPYYWRNKYLHSNLTAPVFYSYSDVEISCLKVMNYFIETYIGTNLPDWFVVDTTISSKKQNKEISALHKDMYEGLCNMFKEHGCKEVKERLSSL